jgi:hypothetical protein
MGRRAVAVGSSELREFLTNVGDNYAMTSTPLATAATRSAFVVAVAATILLAGCAPTSPSGSSGENPDTGSGTGATGCDIYAGQTDPELMLFTTSALAAGPSAGQVYGDGTEFSVTLSQEAIDAGLLPQFEIVKLSENGGPELVSSLAFDPTTGGDGTYSTSTFEFGNDELVGTAVVAEIFAISDATVGDAVPYGNKLLLGNYCITYGNDGS